jgi:hypothetical protein
MATTRQSTHAQTSISPAALGAVFKRLRSANAVIAEHYPGETGDRQPVHTVYGGAHLFRSDTARKMGGVARSILDAYAPDAETLDGTFGLTERFGDAARPPFAATIRARVVEKLEREPVEDFRIDFEDGYGVRPDIEEDGHAQAAAEQMADGWRAATLPPFIGIRIKPMSQELHRRSLRTLDLFITALLRRTSGQLPSNFVVTIPKIMAPGHVAAVASSCDALERARRLRRGSIKLELMVETPQSILEAGGSSALRSLVAAGRGRVTGAHFGTYDYTALCGITAAWQHMRHAACDFAKHMMQVALAQSGIRLSDGATNVMPIAPHRGTRLSDAERAENADDVQHSLVNGFYQGWDLHPAQLPSRYAAVYAFFLAARPAATARLRNFVDKAAQATLVGDVFDDAATGQGLLNYFLRALNCGAIDLTDIEQTGLTAAEVELRSFAKILAARRARLGG